MLKGTEESRLNRSEPVPARTGDTVVPPVELSEGARAVWDQLSPDLIDRGVLTPWDAHLFAAFCDAAATYWHTRELIGTEFLVPGTRKGSMVRSPLWMVLSSAEQQMAQLGARFGLTPGDRAGLTIAADEAALSGPERLLT
ncbi:phage terminase small subunit P27 family [Mycolicibacterium sp. CR10]|uniref:phage terminase small subunit P27 family n=1 Tax=Mycolicibacterium sp. CR10 TaxID=2562314 RepID=UPI00197C86E8|nr:phage terminase small subunit P27 family [Mycolicibacterium sp. CR10]